MSATVKVRALRALMFDGICYGAGVEFKLSAADAAQALESGRAELVSDADRPAVRQAAEAAVAAVLRRTAGNRLMSMTPPDPWQPLGRY
jgi:hypothetical protein